MNRYILHSAGSILLVGSYTSYGRHIKLFRHQCILILFPKKVNGMSWEKLLWKLRFRIIRRRPSKIVILMFISDFDDSDGNDHVCRWWWSGKLTKLPIHMPCNLHNDLTIEGSTREAHMKVGAVISNSFLAFHTLRLCHLIGKDTIHQNSL